MITLLLTLIFATCVAVGFPLLLVWRERVKNRKREIERLRALSRERYRPLPQTQPDVYPYQRVVKARAAEDIPAGTVVAYETPIDSLPPSPWYSTYSLTEPDPGYVARAVAHEMQVRTEDTGPTREVLPPVFDSPATAEAYSPSCDYSPSGDSCPSTWSYDAGNSSGWGSGD